MPVIAQDPSCGVEIVLPEAPAGSSSGVLPTSELLDDNDDEPPIRSRRKRKIVDVGSLSQCLCGQTVSIAQIETGQDVAQCRKAGCETEWVSSRNTGLLAAWLNVVQYHLQCVEMELVPRNWVCVSCLSSRPARVWKRTRKG